MKENYDLVVIGAGSGGVAASRRAAVHGARVLIVEADRVGGTCVIRGCVPKKLMMYAAGFAQALEEARGYGWAEVSGRFEMGRWADAKAAEITRLEGIYRQMLADGGVELAQGRAQLLGARHGGDGHAPGAGPAHPGGHRRRALARRPARPGRGDDVQRGAGPAHPARHAAGGGRRLHRGRIRQHPGRPGRAGDAGLPRHAAAARLRRRPAHAPGRCAHGARHHAGRRRRPEGAGARRTRFHAAACRRLGAARRGRAQRHRQASEHPRAGPGRSRCAAGPARRHRGGCRQPQQRARHLGHRRRHQPRQPHAGGHRRRPRLCRQRIRRPAQHGWTTATWPARCSPTRPSPPWA